MFAAQEEKEEISKCSNELLCLDKYNEGRAHLHQPQIIKSLNTDSDTQTERQRKRNCAQENFRSNAICNHSSEMFCHHSDFY